MKNDEPDRKRALARELSQPDEGVEARRILENEFWRPADAPRLRLVRGLRGVTRRGE